MITIITKGMLEKLINDLRWGRIKVKSEKPNSISVLKGVLLNNMFIIDEEAISGVTEAS